MKEINRINESASGKRLREFMARRTRTNSDDWFLTFRAREAMEIVLDELRRRRGSGEVILQPFTCSTVPESVLAAGLTPHYCDISESGLSLDPGRLAAYLDSRAGSSSDRQNESAIPYVHAAEISCSPGSDARAVILQHTYGIFDDSNERKIAGAARSAGALLMEDCAQCAGRMAYDTDGTPLCDVSVHSFGVEKMIKSSFGAATWIDPDMEDKALLEGIRRRLAELPATDPKISRSVPQYITRIRILNHLPMKIKKPLRSYWVSKKRFVPGVDKCELEGHTLLAPSTPDITVTDRVLAALSDINSNEAVRQSAVALYLSELDTCSEYRIPEAVRAGWADRAESSVRSSSRALLWFPVIVRSEARALAIVRRLAANGYYSSTWGRPLIFPGVTDPEIFRLPQAERDCPVAAACSEGIVLLPTRQDSGQIREIIRIFKESVVRPGEDDFVPILLGTETNVYNMARSFYEEYGVVSQAYGRVPLPQSAASKFVNVTCHDDFTDPERFVNILNEDAHLYRGRKAVVISCGDNYTRILSSVKDRLDPVYVPVCPDRDTVDAVGSKVRLYEFCEKAGIPYPGTVLISSPDIPELPFGFPLVLKPDDADDYYAHPFEGQKKAFIIQDAAELADAAQRTYDAGYSGIMVIQEFIPGSDDNMRVVNGYKRTDGTVALMSMGQPLLEDYYPMAIGNYNVILASGDDRVYDTVEQLLNAMPYLGYFNMDLKYDPRDDKFKVFDFNPRMGRSSYYVTLAGHNLAGCVVDDIVLGESGGTVRSYNEVLWTDVPVYIVGRYIENKEQKDHAMKLIMKGRSGGTFRRAGDRNLRRFAINLKADLRSIRNYHRYFVPKNK